MMADPGRLVLAALLLPAAAFLILAIVAPLRRSGRLAGLFSILGAAGSLAAALAAWRGYDGAATRLAWEWLPAPGKPLATIGVLADETSTVMLVLVALVSLLVQVYSLGYLSDEAPPALGRYYTYQSLFAFSMMGLVLAPDLVQLFICWELVGLCSYLLIGFWYQKPEAARAAVKAFWTTKAGDVGLLIGIVMLWHHTGTFDLSEMRLMAGNGEIAVVGLSIITFCIYLGAMGKSAQFPLHVWLPDAMEGPTPVSALIHAATMVTAGVYLLHRLSWLFALTPDVLMIVAWIGAFTALLAAVLACVQDDIKRVLAYSTVSQLGYMMAAIGAGFSAAGFFHLLTHGVIQGAALPRRRRRDSCRRQQRSVANGWSGTAPAADGDRLHRGNVVAGRHSTLWRLPVERGNSRRRMGGRHGGTVCTADAGGVSHGLLHVPRRVSRVLCQSGCLRACRRGGSRSVRRQPGSWRPRIA